MHPTFRSRFEARGQSLNLMGDAVRDMSREELYAVIGFLLDMSDVEEIETQLGRYSESSESTPDQSRGMRKNGIASDEVPSNNGIFEGWAAPSERTALRGPLMAAKKKNSLVANINRRKRAGKSRPKSKSTVSKKSYRDMQRGWRSSKRKKSARKKRSTKKTRSSSE